MDGRSTFVAQVAALQEQHVAATSAFGVLTELDPRLESWVQGGLAESLDRLGAELDGLAGEAERHESLGACWSDLRAAAEEASDVFAEVLALAEGAWARSRRLDGGVCRFGDAFAAELNSRTDLDWDRLTVPAERESYADVAQVIRVRFPAVGLWELPLVAHEFGHYAAERLDVVARRGYVRRRGLPFAAVAEREAGDPGPGERPGAWAHMQEYFADAFATYIAGPAPLAACLVLRFQPRGAHEDEFDHPSAAKRVQLMLAVLARLDEDRVGMRRFKRRAEDLAALWATTLAAAGESPELDADEQAEVDERVDELYPLLRTARRTAAYDGLHRAEALALHLRGTRSAPALTSGHHIADVLNAAWLARLDAWSERPEVPTAIEQRGRAFCDALMARNGSPH